MLRIVACFCPPIYFTYSQETAYSQTLLANDFYDQPVGCQAHIYPYYYQPNSSFIYRSYSYQSNATFSELIKLAPPDENCGGPNPCSSIIDLRLLLRNFTGALVTTGTTANELTTNAESVTTASTGTTMLSFATQLLGTVFASSQHLLKQTQLNLISFTQLTFLLEDFFLYGSLS